MEERPQTHRREELNTEEPSFQTIKENTKKLEYEENILKK